MIETHGAENTEKLIKSWIGNLATDVFSDDTALLQAIDEGQCDVGIVNTYYYGRVHKQNPDLKVKLFWLNQDDRVYTSTYPVRVLLNTHLMLIKHVNS